MVAPIIHQMNAMAPNARSAVAPGQNPHNVAQVALPIINDLDLNALDNQGMTALMQAAHFGNLDIVHALIDHAAEII